MLYLGIGRTRTLSTPVPGNKFYLGIGRTRTLSTPVPGNMFYLGIGRTRTLNLPGNRKDEDPESTWE